MQNRRNEPSRAMVHRMATAAPEKLVEEISQLRAERDGLRQTLRMNLAEQIRKLKLDKHDILVMKRILYSTGDEAFMKVMQGLSEMMKEQLGWEGILIVTKDGVEADKMPEEVARKLYEVLKARFDTREGKVDAKS